MAGRAERNKAGRGAERITADGCCSTVYRYPKITTGDRHVQGSVERLNSGGRRAHRRGRGAERGRVSVAEDTATGHATRPRRHATASPADEGGDGQMSGQQGERGPLSFRPRRWARGGTERKGANKLAFDPLRPAGAKNKGDAPRCFRPARRRALPMQAQANCRRWGPPH